MTRTTKSSHVLGLIPEYVLGLLPGDDADLVAAHLAICGECRQAVSNERDVGRNVRDTLSIVSTPDRGRIRHLMPTPPASAARTGLVSPRFAVAGLMLVLLFGAFALFDGQRPGTWTISAPTVHSTAVVLTDTPTQTATREIVATAERLGAYASPQPTGSPSAAYRDRMPAPAMIPVPAPPLLH